MKPWQARFFVKNTASLFDADRPKLRGFLQTMDNLIESRELQIERKHFHVEFRENDRGKFLRITEEAHGRRNTIIIPSTGVDEFTAAIDEVIDHAERAPA